MKNLIFIFLFTALFSCSNKENSAIEDMALVPAGEFTMGSNEGTSDEAPERKVYVKSFFIDKYAVSNEKYKEFIDSTKHPMPKPWLISGYNSEFKDHPVVFINLDSANTYCSWLGKRLPSEEEWEKGSRGVDGRKYPWGNHFDKVNANTSAGGIMATVPVNSYKQGKSPYGLFNMAGNVWEWTRTTGQGEKRILKGGSWGLSHRFSRTFSRVEYDAKSKTNNIGFRCAKEQ